MQWSALTASSKGLNGQDQLYPITSQSLFWHTIISVRWNDLFTMMKLYVTGREKDFLHGPETNRFRLRPHYHHASVPFKKNKIRLKTDTNWSTLVALCIHLHRLKIDQFIFYLFWFFSVNVE